jgi:hypothetical protein
MEQMMECLLAEMKALLKPYLEEMNATDLEANREKSEAVAMHQEVPDEEAAAETVREPQDRTM